MRRGDANGAAPHVHTAASTALRGPSPRAAVIGRFKICLFGPEVGKRLFSSSRGAQKLDCAGLLTASWAGLVRQPWELGCWKLCWATATMTWRTKRGEKQVVVEQEEEKQVVSHKQEEEETLLAARVQTMRPLLVPARAGQRLPFSSFCRPLLAMLHPVELQTEPQYLLHDPAKQCHCCEVLHSIYLRALRLQLPFPVHCTVIQTRRYFGVQLSWSEHTAS